MLDNVTTVRGYALYLGLDPTKRSVLRKIQRQCERGDLQAKLECGTWLIKVPQENKGEIEMRDWRSLQDVYFSGKILVHAGGGSSLNNNKVSQFYVDQVPMGKDSNHFSVTWDCSEFFDKVATDTFEWPRPHAAAPEEDSDIIIDYWRRFKPYGREIEFNGRVLKIINRPVEFIVVAGELTYFAGAVDQDGQGYQVYWNVLNMFPPSEIKMTVDKGRYCKHCLQSWTASADYSKCEHEWIKND